MCNGFFGSFSEKGSESRSSVWDLVFCKLEIFDESKIISLLVLEDRVLLY